MMRILPIILTLVALGCSINSVQNFGALDTLQYKNNNGKLNGFISCMLKIDRCKGLDAHIQARAVEIIDSACATCSDDEKAVIHDLVSLVAHKNIKILKGIFKRYDLKSRDGKGFIQVISTFPSKANISYTPVPPKNATTS